MAKMIPDGTASHGTMKPAPIAVRLPETGNFQRQPCSNCPWRKDAPRGEFDAEDFRRLAHTAYDMDHRIFTCHKSREASPVVCAGFLLRGADHNLSVRLNYMDAMHQVDDAGLDLYENYRAMAVANGVDPDDPVLKRCRD